MWGGSPGLLPPPTYMEIHAMSDLLCSNCGKEIPPSKYSFTTGYGTNENGDKICYRCCAALELDYMREHGRTVLYLSLDEDATKADYGHKRYKITDWPGQLKFTPINGVYVGRHNWGIPRYDCWFADRENPDGTQYWHGVQYGDDTQLIHCRRIKRLPSHLRRFA